MKDYSLTLHPPVEYDDAATPHQTYLTGAEGVFCVQSLLKLLAMIDAEKLRRHAEGALDADQIFEHLGIFGSELLSAALTHFERLEDARMQSDAATLEKGGEGQ